MMRLNRPLHINKLDDEKGIFEGYGNVFNVVDHHRHIVEPGAFLKSLNRWNNKGRFPALLWQHDTEKPIGIYEHMAEDEHGLQVRGRLLVDEVPLAREAWALLKAGAIGGLSIGYNTVQAEHDNNRILHIKEIDLWEVSLVTFPANEEAGVTHIKTIREFEKFLRDSGFSRREALQIASSGFKNRRDADDEAEEDGETAALIKAALLQNIRIIKGE